MIDIARVGLAAAGRRARASAGWTARIACGADRVRCRRACGGQEGSVHAIVALGAGAVVKEEIQDIIVSAVRVAEVHAARARGGTGTAACEARRIAGRATGVHRGSTSRRLEGIATAHSAREAVAGTEPVAAIAGSALVNSWSRAGGAIWITGSTHSVGAGRASADGELTGGARRTRLARANSVEEIAGGAASAHGVAGA